jgi:acyl-CoA dehydrogenase
MLTEEQREIQALAREFAEGEIRPHAARWDETRELDDPVFEKLAELGFMGMLVPERYGGLGLDWTTYLLVLEELAWGDAAVALSVAIHNGPVAELLLAHGGEAQKERWLPKLASGELLGAFALSEPGAGSDASGITTTAERAADGGGWTISGEKRFVTNGGRAGLVALFARTDDGPPQGRVGCFLVEPGEGWRVGEREKTMGLRASETVTVTLDRAAVDADAVVGEPGEGLRYAMEALDVGRVGIGAQAVGIARAAFEHAVEYSLEREQFDQPIARFGAIQEKLAEMAARIEGARALVLSAGELLESRMSEDGGFQRASEPGQRVASSRAAMAKLLASRTAMWVTDEAVQIFGGYGYMRDYPVEKLMRDAKGTEIYEGTSEILRIVIAREVLAARGH